MWEDWQGKCDNAMKPCAFATNYTRLRPSETEGRKALFNHRTTLPSTIDFSATRSSAAVNKLHETRCFRVAVSVWPPLVYDDGLTLCLAFPA
jgi:hypothetical protein